jgi:hypothetical protein
VLALFIDGPLTGEVKEISPMPTWRVRLPERWTLCFCADEDYGDMLHDADSEIVIYHAVLSGIQGHAAIMSIHTDETALFDSLKNWITTEFRQERWVRYCRSDRAFT